VLTLWRIGASDDHPNSEFSARSAVNISHPAKGRRSGLRVYEETP
jgi:hypothetical protein